MKTIKDLREKIKDLPDEAPVILIDGSTDDSDGCTSPDEIFTNEYVSEEDNEIKGDALYLSYYNHHRVNPVFNIDGSDNKNFDPTK